MHSLKAQVFDNQKAGCCAPLVSWLRRLAPPAGSVQLSATKKPWKGHSSFVIVEIYKVTKGKISQKMSQTGQDRVAKGNPLECGGLAPLWAVATVAAVGRVGF
jgi:hypothetical protein